MSKSKENSRLMFKSQAYFTSMSALDFSKMLSFSFVNTLRTPSPTVPNPIIPIFIFIKVLSFVFFIKN